MPAGLLALAVGCGGSPSESGLVVRDSAGVEIVESTRARWQEAEAWSLSGTPRIDLALTGTGPPHEFFRVTDALRLDDGRIAVADDGADEIRVFSAAGDHLLTFGRGGEGPGEFSRIRSLSGYRGDSILVYDYWLGRATLLDHAFSLGRIISRDRPDVRLNDVGPLSNGSLVGPVFSIAQLESFQGLTRVPLTVVRLSDSGVVQDTLLTFPGYESFWYETGDARAMWNKNGHLAVHNDRIYVGTADSMEYEIWSPAGVLERLVRVPGYDLNLSADELRKEWEAINPPTLPERFRAVNARMPEPTARPAYADLVVDGLGNVWLAEAHALVDRDSATDWQVFDSGGQWLGQVTVPERFRVFEIGADYVLGVWRDPDDVQHVQVLDLDRR